MASRSTRAPKQAKRAARRRTATTPQAQTAFSHVYLTRNRLKWWDVAPPVSGPIQFGGGGIGQQSFDREFYSSLATIVGHDVKNDRSFSVTPIAVRIDWAGSYTVNTIRPPRVPFQVRAQAAGIGDPRFAMITLRGDRRADRNVIVHRRKTGDGSPLSIILDFPDGQRAIGIECGFTATGNASFNEGAFKLRAWRGDGSAIAEATGADLSATDWQSNTLYRLGARDQGGDIRTIELLCDDPGFGAGNELFIHSVWYEPLPPAAVLQGTIVNSSAAVFTAYQQPAHPDIAPDLAGDPAFVPGPLIVNAAVLQLPHGCDRAVAFLRGFKIIPGVIDATHTTAPDPQKLSQLGVVLRQLSTAAEVASSRIFRFRVEHSTRWGEEGERGDVMVAAYFTVVAWNARRAELFVSDGGAASRELRRRDVGLVQFPNQRPGVQGGFADPVASLGPLFGGARGFSMTFPRPVELQGFIWTLGWFGGRVPDPDYFEDESSISIGDFITGALIISGIAPILVLGGNWLGSGGGKFSASAAEPPPLGYAQQGAAIAWSWKLDIGDTIDSDERVTSGLVGHAIGGPSLRLPPDYALTLSGHEQPSRSTQPAPFFRTMSPAMTFDLAIDADMAFPVLGLVGMVPEDEIRELDVEVRAGHFDGAVMSLAIGGGIEVGSVGDNDEGRLMNAAPYIAGISRTPTLPRRATSTRELVFDWIHNLVTLAPRQAGRLRNDGNMPLGIVSITLAGIHASEFLLNVTHAGRTIGLHEFAARGPRTLMPGEELVFTGRFFSTSNPNPPRKQRIRRHAGEIVVQCARPQDDVVIVMRAEVIAQDAAGEFLPPTLAFGNVSLPAPGAAPRWTTRLALMTSNGASPLFVRSLTFAPAIPGLIVGLHSSTSTGSGFAAAGALYTIDPGTSATFNVSWQPPAVGPMETTLTADTNAGPLSIRVRGTAVPWPGRV